MTPHLEPVSTSEPLEWLAEHLTWRWMGSGLAVGSFFPDTFEAYARILHPARTRDEGLVSWSEVATWSGKRLEPTSSFRDLAARPDGETWAARGASPREEMERDAVAHLAPILGRFTATPGSSWFCVWEGYGRLQVDQPALELSRDLTGSGRKYFVLQGPVEAASQLELPSWGAPLVAGGTRSRVGGPEPGRLEWFGPNFWWPQDRAWFYADEVDGHSTYVGGSAALIEELLADPVLEVVPASPDDPFEGFMSDAQVP